MCTVPDASVSAHYLGERGVRYAQWQLGGSKYMGAIVARKFNQFVSATDTVLDFGCGGGATLLALQCGRRLGVEPNEAALNAARTSGMRPITL